MSKERIYTNLCIKCNKETVWSRVRDVTLKEHGINNHVIAIDDADIFGQKQSLNGKIVCDYSDITKDRIESLLKNIMCEKICLK